MSDEIITAYPHAIPDKQTQNYPGLDKDIKGTVEYTKLEVFDDEGKPSLIEYKGADKLKGKTAIVTGGDSGIGRAAAAAFSREGAKGITITYMPPELEDAKDAQKLLEEGGAEVQIVECNLKNEDDAKKVVDAHIKKWGSVDILVNNASQQFQCPDLAEISMDQVSSTFQANIIQMFAMTKFSLPHMRRGGSIINTTSVTAYAGSPAMVDYSSTKGAIVSFTRALANQLAPKGIRVNAVAPGPVLTALQPATRSAEQMEGWGAGVPLHGRAAQPAELAPTYVFLASSRDSNVITGQVIHINNGKQMGSS